MSQHYKGRIIDARAYELADGSGWSAEVYVAEEVEDETIDTQFLLKEKFPTKEAALEAGAAVGRRKIDEQIRSHEIQTLIEEQTRLPSTHRHGFGHSTDDVSTGIDGNPTKVPGPQNPDDRFES